MAKSEEVNVGAIVAEIEAEVARKRAAGEYPAALLQRLQAEFRIGEDDDPPEALARIQPSRPLRSEHRGIGPAIVFGKRAMRRLLAWYIQPVAEDQTRFNTAIIREVRRLERRLQRVETPWTRTAGSPAADAGAQRLIQSLASNRSATLRSALDEAVPGPRLVLGNGDVAAALADAQTSVHAGDALEHLAQVSPGSLTAVALVGLLSRLSAAELLRVVPLAATALRPGGVVVCDAPRPGHPALPQDPSGLDVDMVRWIGAETVELLCEAAGLTGIRSVEAGPVDTAKTSPWYAVIARKPG